MQPAMQQATQRDHFLSNERDGKGMGSLIHMFSGISRNEAGLKLGTTYMLVLICVLPGSERSGSHEFFGASRLLTTALGRLLPNLIRVLSN